MLRVNEYWGAFGAGGGADLGTTSDVLFPRSRFMTNDAWPDGARHRQRPRRATAASWIAIPKAFFYVLTFPKTPTICTRCRSPFSRRIKQYIMRDFPV